jgi:phosphorylcholine metabolism protein LicD
MAGTIQLSGKYLKEALRLLQFAHSVFERKGIPYVLEAGTLLGIVREGRLLPWDNDLDITIPYAAYEEVMTLRWTFRAAGYRIKVRRFDRDLGPFKKGMPRLIKVQKLRFGLWKDYSLMDIFVKYPLEDTYQWVISPKSPVLKKTPRRFYDERTRLRFHETDYWVPLDYEAYLAYHYGPDWRIPQPKWDFRLDDHCERELL